MLTLHLYHHCTRAAPAATNLRSMGKTSSVVVQNQDSSRNYYDDDSKLEDMERLQSYITPNLRYMSSEEFSTGSGLALALALWDQNFENGEEACAAANSTIAREGSKGEFCQPNYRCDYNKGRWPSTLIHVNCSYSACRATPYKSPPMESCWGPQQVIPIVIFQQETQVSLDTMTELEERVDERTHTKMEIKGRWVIRNFPLTTHCFCSAK